MPLRLKQIPFQKAPDEFLKVEHAQFNYLKILGNLGLFERLAALCCHCVEELQLDCAVFIEPTHGGFIPLEFLDSLDKKKTQTEFKTIIPITDNQHNQHLLANCKYLNVEHNQLKSNVNITDSKTFDFAHLMTYNLIFSENVNELFKRIAKDYSIFETNILILPEICPGYRHVLSLQGTPFFVHVPLALWKTFQSVFSNEIVGDVLTFDNLIHLCIMVKNAGSQFESMLKSNFHLIDEWTVLDTGSTDETIDIVKRVLVGKKRGNLFQEPFINFRESRNRCLQLAQKRCKYILTLDDTYVVKGDLRGFLNQVRGDQFADSFSLFIESYDNQYASNRIIQSSSELRYIYKIHEVITDKHNLNVIVPMECAYIDDKHSSYMEERSNARKQLDLKLLYEEMEDNPMEPRTYYYLGNTYKMMGEHEKAFFNYMKRSEIGNAGFIQERVDATFEAGRLANFQLNRPWEECLALYEKAFKMDESRPECPYFIGIHHYMNGEHKTAFGHFKRGFEIGYPIHCQFSLKPTLSYYFLPLYIAKLAYTEGEYDFGYKATSLFFQHNPKPTLENKKDFEEMLSWHKIYENLIRFPVKGSSIPAVPAVPVKPWFVFMADGGFKTWSGKSIVSEGVGGSETYIIEMARHLQKGGHVNVIVFCNTGLSRGEIEVFEDVIFSPLENFYSFINTNHVQHCMVSRFSEYLPVALKGFTENVYLVVHDLSPSGLIIPLDAKLKKVLCLTEWHVEYMKQSFPNLENRLTPFYYGIDPIWFFNNTSQLTPKPLLTSIQTQFNFSSPKFQQQQILTHNFSSKVPYRFIYSSFPNRGLLQLLQMWPHIYNLQPSASLHIYCDLDNEWVNTNHKEQIVMIRILLSDFANMSGGMNVNVKGWCKKSELAQAWKEADFWFYPCTFMETFCLTALEAASSQTLVISNDLAALKNTVGNRGIIIPGDPTTSEWKKDALTQLEPFLLGTKDAIKIKEEKIKLNLDWAKTLTWEKQAQRFYEMIMKPLCLTHCEYFSPWPFEKESNADLLHYFNREYSIQGTFRLFSVLEVGTYAGISLVEWMELLPHARGVGLDIWEKQDEYPYMESLQVHKCFHDNVQAKGLEKRVKGVKEDSHEYLLRCLLNKDVFDLILVDGQTSEEGRYMDIWLSWHLLPPGGVILTPLLPIKNVLKKIEMWNPLHKVRGQWLELKKPLS